MPNSLPTRRSSSLLPAAVWLAMHCLLCIPLSAGETALDVIKSRLLTEALHTAGAREATAAQTVALVAQARKMAGELNAEGTWPAVDYADKSRSEWKPQAHLVRLRALALGCRLAPADVDLKIKARRALNTWIAQDLKSDNWWWNDIGAPEALGQVLLLLEPDLTPAELKPALDRLGRAGLNLTGQNRVWLSGIALTRAALLGDLQLGRDAVKSIVSTITIDQPEGIQPDWSFFQHGPCLYSAGYGLGFTADCARYMGIVQGTELAFPAASTEILTHYILDGQCWMIRGDGFDPGAAGREICRPKAIHKGRAVAQACERMAQTAGPRQPEFTAAAARLKSAAVGGQDEPDGDRYFWRSALLVHRRAGFYFSIRMARADLCSGDGLINGENLRSQYLADGVTYLLKTGTEFNGIFGAWDWRRPPGVTNRADAPLEGAPRDKGRRAFAGAATDGRYSVAGMDWANPERGAGFPADQLSAHKAWFCFDREIVCLGSGITCAADHPVLTSVNQTLLTGPVTTAPANGGREATAAGTPDLTHCDLRGPTWVHHAGVGYVFGADAKVHLAAGDQTGSWHDCNSNLPNEKTTLPLFNLWLDHGRQPQNATYAYTVLPDINLRELPAAVETPAVEVLANTTALQAVRHSTLKIVAAVFYQPGSLALGDGQTVQVDRSCLLLMRDAADGGRTLSVSKPDADGHNPGAVKIHVSQGDQAAETTVVLPGGAQCGSSATGSLPPLR